MNILSKHVRTWKTGHIHHNCGDDNVRKPNKLCIFDFQLPEIWRHNGEFMGVRSKLHNKIQMKIYIILFIHTLSVRECATIVWCFFTGFNISNHQPNTGIFSATTYPYNIHTERFTEIFRLECERDKCDSCVLCLSTTQTAINQQLSICIYWHNEYIYWHFSIILADNSTEIHVILMTLQN